MKTEIDFTLPFTLMGFGLFFIIPLIFIQLKFVSVPFLLCSTLFLFFSISGFYKMESIEITNTSLVKRNFLGLIKSERTLSKLISLNIKFTDMDLPSNPLNVLKLLLSDSDKYLKSHMISIFFNDNFKI